ncbi:tetratricopeptide repeat protein, partial [Nostoc sp. NIES-2111]
PNAYWFRAHSLTQLGRHAEAVAALRQAVALSPAPLFRAALAFALARHQARSEASQILQDLSQSVGPPAVSPVDLAMIHAALGQRDAALEALEVAWRRHDVRLQSLGPEFDSLQSDPRFTALLQRIRARGLARGDSTATP